MARPQDRVKPIDQEVVFGLDELFFSTTDRAGVIRSGNEVFVRLSKYRLEDLLGKPHNVIRHPDMPRAVFFLLWDYLLSGRMIAAYVKNMAADGTYYWVLALAMPLPEGGFLSIRVKPSSELFGVVKSLYSSLRKFERERAAAGDKPKDVLEASVARMHEAIAEHGFESYDDFMYEALHKEMRSRDTALADRPKRKPSNAEAMSMHPLMERLDALGRTRATVDTLYERAGEILALQDDLAESVKFAGGLSRRFQRAAMNTAIRSAGIETDAHGLGTVAAHLGESAKTVQERADSFGEQATRTSRALQRNAFHLATIRLGVETLESFCIEAIEAGDAGDTTHRLDSRQSLDAILTDLHAFVDTLLEVVDTSLHELEKDLTAMATDSEGLRRTVMMLRFAQFAGVVESARLDVETTVGPLLKEIRDSIEQAQQELTTLGDNIERLGARVEAMPRTVVEIRDRLDGLKPEESAAAA